MQAASNQLAPSGRVTGFPGFFDRAVTRLSAWRNSREYALELGVDEEALERYATGAISMYERSEIEPILVKCQWAMNYVARLAKAQRSA